MEWFKVIFFVVIGFLVWYGCEMDRKCIEKGGTVIRGTYWFQCAKLEKVE